MGYVLELRQRLTVIKNRYDIVRIDDGETQLAYAEQADHVSDQLSDPSLARLAGG